MKQRNRRLSSAQIWAHSDPEDTSAQIWALFRLNARLKKKPGIVPGLAGRQDQI
jgi:hypothetical protein